MKRNLAAIIACGLLSYSVAFAVAPENLHIAKDRVKQYHDAGTYLKDQQAVIQLAKRYVLKRVEHNHTTALPRKLAIVFDIDETALSNYQHMLAYDFGGNHALYDQWEGLADDPAIQPTLDLYKTALRNKVRICFITGRPEKLREKTIRNLKSAGYTRWNSLSLRQASDKNLSVTAYKTQARIAIERRGYEIIANIGDQYSDLNGRHADSTFKLPNPFYSIP